MREPEQAQAFAEEAFGDIRIEVLPSELPFEWRVQGLDLGPVAIMPANITGKIQMRGTVTGTILHVLPSGGARAGDHRQEVALASGRAGAVYSIDTYGWWHGEGTYLVPAIRFAPGFLRRQLELLTGTTIEREPRFGFELSTARGPGAMIERFCRFMLADLVDTAAVSEQAVVATSLSDLFARALLVGHAHDHSHLLARQARPAPPGVVRQVEDYVRAHASEPISLGDLALLTSTGAGAIDAAFQAQRGKSVTAFIRGVRLERARDLLHHDPTLTPTRAAYEAGFVQPERFAAEYLVAFGEQPEQTWRQTQARLGLGPSAHQELFIARRPKSAPTVFVLCDEPARAARIHGWLRAAGHAVELFDSIGGFVRGDRPTRPGCVVVDLALADHGSLAEEAPTLPRIGIATTDLRTAIAAMKAGAVDVLGEQHERAELLAAVEAALARDVARRRDDEERMQRAARLAVLTAREREVLDGVARGLLNKQIAAELGISEATVRFHRANGTGKLGVDSVAELVRLLTGE